MKRKILSFFIASIFLFTACSSTNPTDQSGDDTTTTETAKQKIVYTSFYPIYDFTSKIVGDKMDVRLIIPAGAEPHDYEVGVKTLTEMSDADSIFLLGLEFEPWSEKLDAQTKEKIVLVGEQARPMEYTGHDHDEHHDEDQDHEEDEHHDEDQSHEEDEHHDDADHHDEDADHEEGHHHHHGLHDPHVWMDPTRGIDMSKSILTEVIKLDPENEEFYTKNYEDLQSKFVELDEKLKQVAEKHKDSHKDIVVSHNAFSYLTDTYGIHFTSIAGLSPEVEPSLKRISEIIDEIKQKDIRYIFFEELSNSKLIESISKETQAKVDVLYTIEGMTDDEMTKGEDYFYKMNQNIEKIDLALQ